MFITLCSDYSTVSILQKCKEAALESGFSHKLETVLALGLMDGFPFPFPDVGGA